MAYLLNSVDLFTTYGIYPGHAPGSNIAMSGIFDMPARNGKTYHSWGDEHGIEPYVASGDIQFAGRDIVFHGFTIGESSVINARLKALRDTVKAFTTLVVLSTPYGDFTVSVKDIQTRLYNGASSVIITFRESVVNLTNWRYSIIQSDTADEILTDEGLQIESLSYIAIPATTEGVFTIDGILLSSFGLYLSIPVNHNNLPDSKEQYVTDYASEGSHVTKRKNQNLLLQGFIKEGSLDEFKDNIRKLYILFSSIGIRNIKINDEVSIGCFAADGFKVNDILVHSGGVIAKYNISLTVVHLNTIGLLNTDSSEEILAESGNHILV